DAVGPGLVDGLQRDRLAVHVELAAVRLLVAAEDLHQGGLAGPVVAEQGQHLALVQPQVHVRERRHAAEALGDVLDAQCFLLLSLRHQARPALRSRDRYTLAIMATRMASPSTR